jgi:hypothetical protein
MELIKVNVTGGEQPPFEELPKDYLLEMLERKLKDNPYFEVSNPSIRDEMQEIRNGTRKEITYYDGIIIV